MTDVNEEKTTYISPLEDLVVEESWKSLIIKIKKLIHFLSETIVLRQ